MPTFRGAIGVLNPFGPIFTKELRVTSRRKRTYWLRVIYLALLLLVLLATYASTREFRGAGTAARAQQQATMGAVFFMCFSMFCIIAMGLIAPVLTATAINAERLHKTLHVLLMTPIGNAQIVSGKLFSRLLVALTLIGLSLPVLALVRLLGGVETWQMIGVISVCASFALSCAAIGLFYSAVLRRAYAVILLSYGSLLLLYMFIPMCVAIWGRGSQGLGWIPVFCATNPVMCTAMMATPDRPMMMRTIQWWPCVAVQLGITLMLVIWTGAMLRRIARREEGTASAPAPFRTLPPPLPANARASAGNPGTASAVAAAKSVPRHVLREVSDNPILWRETRRPLLPKFWQKMAAVIIVLGVLICSYAAMSSANSLNSADTQIGYANIFCGLAWLLSAVLAATAIAQEKESDTWTLLLATPISGWSVVWGKVLGLLSRLLWPAVLLLAHFMLFALCGVIRWTSVLLVMWVILSFNAIWIATGVYLSLRLKKVTTAVIVNLLLAVCAYVIVFIVFITIENLLDRRSDLAEHLGWSMPYVYLSMGMEGIERVNAPFEGPGNVHIWGGGFTTVVFLVGCAYLGVSFAILAHTARHFDRIVGRAIQRNINRQLQPQTRMA